MRINSRLKGSSSCTAIRACGECTAEVTAFVIRCTLYTTTGPITGATTR
jgi:hypothetical protein